MTETDRGRREAEHRAPDLDRAAHGGRGKVGAHKTSMLQDYEAGRPMELDAIVGAVVELGDRLGVQMPATRDRAWLREDAGRKRRRSAVNIHNRWFQLVASVIAMIMIANLQYAWTLFVKPMQQATGWKLSDIQWAFTLFILFQTWVQPAQGFLIDRLGPRVFITAAGVMCGVGWAGLGLVTTLPMLYHARTSSPGSARRWSTAAAWVRP